MRFDVVLLFDEFKVIVRVYTHLCIYLTRAYIANCVCSKNDKNFGESVCFE